MPTFWKLESLRQKYPLWFRKKPQDLNSHPQEAIQAHGKQCNAITNFLNHGGYFRRRLSNFQKAACLPGYANGRRHIVCAPQVLPNEVPTLDSLLESVKHVEGVRMWHLLIDELHVEGLITVLHEAGAVGLCATGCIGAAILCSGENTEALRERLDRRSAQYHSATQATMVSMARHTAEANAIIPEWVIPTC